MNKIILIIVFINITVCSQITITSNDIANQFFVGNSTTAHEDTLQSIVDIGAPGGGNNWDFTTLQSNLMVDLESIDPNSSPYISDFVGANVCIYSTGFSQGLQAEIWTYSKLNGTFDVMGTATTVTSIPGFVTQIKNDPFRTQYEHPMTINSQWSKTVTQSIFINAMLINSSSVSVNSIVDAYGTMTLPGGSSFEALRLREMLTVNGLSSVSYAFVSKSGAQVSVNASDVNPPNSGTISVESTSYNAPLLTSIEQTNSLPSHYNLNQNYPNPFNPNTNIQFSLPQSSFVTLEIFNTLGESIDILVSEELNTGTYNYDWNGIGLTSGVYYYKMQAGDFIETKKMILLK